MKSKIIFRIDDIGASSKQFEVYSKSFIGNFLFLKYLRPFKAWGPYKEISVNLWEEIFKVLDKYKTKATIAITASWVDRNGNLIPYPEKFPKEARVIKEAVKKGIIEIANHGLTHCVEGKHLPRVFLSNRNFHREFWQWVPKETHDSHLKQSQRILEGCFGKVVTFVPPGNVWTKDTEYAAFKYRIRFLCSRPNLVRTGKKSNGLTYISDSDSFAIHDRDIVINGINWLDKKIQYLASKKLEIITAKEFGGNLT